MGQETNIRSTRGLRRHTRSKTQVIFFDSAQIIKADREAQSHRHECKIEADKEVSFSKNDTKAFSVSSSERMFSFKDLLKTFNSLEGKASQKTSGSRSSISSIESLSRDTMMKRREMFDRAFNDVSEQKRHVYSFSRGCARD
ncbi:hypothetical protein EHEL_100380 [Encephalitozoon hellem ATCC 50504]|uniref:Uncharacterized protein n=1 Tax=Encephalitozoon hellem TaxID=27973 RepID=A0A9Q9CDZ7_ENCHE|nr:uncharacterized protein EHEL_100380 [Encephalitozoon hellem ATCC 50504]AFM99132.1 hypothetical protein EHEL_100380 [Encephalitozoon hellem ATCC 50504]UTX44118.1 hypothetical protein GPU96_10g19070 [Encephalitozoon hellem]WEL39607.1 hypothetical protein PFJ87_10g00540 [Encephalitozoon hellem]|eukprot:XP_003888113.1 hypothetical protein EHEL_100380 [Encephalitozoon hellem ATCC 50504]